MGASVVGGDGAVGRVRTCGLRVTKAALCHLSYDSGWSSRWESNPRGAGTVSTVYKTEPLREVAAVVSREGLDPPASAFEARRSVRLS